LSCAISCFAAANSPPSLGLPAAAAYRVLAAVAPNERGVRVAPPRTGLAAAAVDVRAAEPVRPASIAAARSRRERRADTDMPWLLRARARGRGASR